MEQKVWSARWPLRVGFASIFLLVGGIGAWSIGTQIAGAIVASGTVEVESERQVIQHPDGGVVGEIFARDGDVVSAGDILVRLDGTFLTSELIIIERQLAESYARRARLVAERDGADTPDFGDPPEFALIGPDEIRDQVDGQRNLFEARRASLAQELKQLAEQTVQIERGVDGIKAQLVASDRQLAIVQDELESLEKLLSDGLIEISRVLALRREEAGFAGEVGRLTAAVAEAEARISALEIERLRVADARREEA
ncbi:MAG: HlyD family type I secretion periplasmic adaptor subunit, partial [Pseudomonadota bacterium]